jgi:hypothetical protein
MPQTLTSGYDFVINQRVNGVNTPMYPFTKAANVEDAEGNNLITLLAGKAAVSHGNHVPDFTGETTSSLKFLRNDNTWAEIQAASTSQAGVVQLSDSVALNDSTVAATAAAVKSVKDSVDALSTTLTDGYVLKSQLGVASTTGANPVTGVATLDTNGKVPSAQLPSYVDDVVDVGIYTTDLTKAYDATGAGITLEEGKIYIADLEVTPSGQDSPTVATSKTYRWSGTTLVEISESLALGETSSTAYRGDYGAVAYAHSQAAHARVDATKTESSENNGYIKINGAETLVYTHPGSGTNPHGTTAADLGLGNVENKSASDILDEITATLITTKLGYTPQNSATIATASNSGVMSAAMVTKLNNCTQTEIVAAGSSPTITDGIVFQIVATA